MYKDVHTAMQIPKQLVILLKGWYLPAYEYHQLKNVLCSDRHRTLRNGIGWLPTESEGGNWNERLCILTVCLEELWNYVYAEQIMFTVYANYICVQILFPIRIQFLFPIDWLTFNDFQLKRIFFLFFFCVV